MGDITPQHKQDIVPDAACIKHLFDELRGISWLDETKNREFRGVFTPGYTFKENAAINIIVKEAGELGMQSFSDLAGNVYMIYPGEDRSSTLVTGSHLDSVKNAGQYDGRAGVIGPMAVLKTMHDAGIKPAQDICVMICRNEESSFYGRAYLGSTLATTMDTNELNGLLALRFCNPVAGPAVPPQTLEDKMKEIGLDTSLLRAALSKNQTLFPLPNVAGFLELHIEQGPVLNKLKADDKEKGFVGIVDAVRGNVRFNDVRSGHNVIKGKPGHSGAVPMEFRSDSVMAALEFLNALKAKTKELRDQGKDLTFTITHLKGGDEAAPTTIPDRCEMKFEFRSTDKELLAQLPGIVNEARDAVTTKNGVSLTTATPVATSPATMDAALRENFGHYAQSLGIPARSMSSGAGHDVVNFANRQIPSALLFIEHARDSHDPAEDMDPKSFINACRMLGQAFIDPVLVKHSGKTLRPGSSVFIDALQERGAKLFDGELDKETDPYSMRL